MNTLCNKLFHFSLGKLLFVDRESERNSLHFHQFLHRLQESFHMRQGKQILSITKAD